MREIINSCGRAEDLVTYLYGEANADEAKDFEGHSLVCEACRAELAAFGGVREAIGDWRQQALGTLTHPAVEPNASPLFNAAETSKPWRAPSALAALREFFALSTAWVRAATVAVALAFCALVVIAVAHFFERPRTVVVEKQIKSGYSQEELDARIAEAVKRQKDSGVQEISAPEKIQQANGATPVVASQKGRERRSTRPQMASNTRAPQRVRRSSVQPSTELASTEYLPFTAGDDDETLPTLADLVDDANQE
ncbi:MAG TPA: hypothetical protein VGC87_09060 [Pyrinomonadaceae bacterium]|jgi:hypothetical protein